MINYAIMITTLNRVEHLKRCVCSLQNNHNADQMDLFISVDYPPSEIYFDGYQKVKEYLKVEITGFKSVKIFYQEKNLGSHNNSMWLVDKVFEEHDGYIFTEDDNEFAPGFLDYINDGVSNNKDDKMSAICGHSFPFLEDFFDDNREKSVKIYSLLNAWGFAMSKEEHYRMVEYIEHGELEKLWENPKAIFQIKKAQNFLFVNYVDYLIGKKSDMVLNGKLIKMDQTMAIYMILNNKYEIMPVLSKVRNWGADGSGIHNDVKANTYNWEKQPIDESIDCSIAFSGQLNDKNRMNRLVNRYIKISRSLLFKKTVQYLLFWMSHKNAKNRKQ